MTIIRKDLYACADYWWCRTGCHQDQAEYDHANAHDTINTQENFYVDNNGHLVDFYPNIDFGITPSFEI